MFHLFLDVTWKPVSCPLERRIEELLGTLQPGDGLLVNELPLLGRAKGPWGMSKLDGKGLARGFAQSLCCISTPIWALPLVTEIVLQSRDYVDLDRLIEVDTKYHSLKSILTDFLREHLNEKVVVFSTFRATLDYLAGRLEADGVSCIQLKGGQRETKDDTITRFSDPDGPSVLLSSEVGGEGVDLQFSRVVINYDLPWNPMRLEQRIGRIDRLGQKADKVLIWNILYANTIDSRIYRRLYDKLDLCRTALGDFEAILGDEIRKLEIDLLSGHLSVEQQERRIDRTAQALENRRLDQATRELHRWISGTDIQRYVFDYLRLHYPGCDLRQAV